jgi:4-aminobutyrate aminotransferase-like enzyme
MGPKDLNRNVLQDLAANQLSAGPMTLWFQQTGSDATEYAIELVFETVQ